MPPEVRDASAYTPAMQQYLEMKRRHPDCLLLYRMGDFFEIFFEDAQLASRELEITLTSRESAGERIPMAGVPHHAVEGYLARLIEKGYRVAICDQVEDPRFAKGLVKREITRLVTPGTLLESQFLAEKSNNFLAALFRGQTGFGLAYCDVSTGEFRCTELGSGGLVSAELQRLMPSEVLVPVPPGLWQDVAWGRGPIRLTPDRLDPAWEDALGEMKALTPRPDHFFSVDRARKSILDHFKVVSLEPFGLEDRPMATAACGAVLAYLEETQIGHTPPFQAIATYRLSDFVGLDGGTRRNLELLATARDGQAQGSLLAVLDCTQTAMGGRRLRRWVLHPLLDPAAIRARQDAVADLAGAPPARQNLAVALGRVRDLERLSTRVSAGTANARDLVALRDSLDALPALAAAVGELESPLLAALNAIPEGLLDLRDAIAATLVDAPPISLSEGGLIRTGVSAELDRLRGMLTESETWLSALETQERERTGIRSLKIGHSKTFGYFIEVTHANRDAVPIDYQRKQTLVNAERYVTPQLKEREGEMLTAKERIQHLEYDLFAQLRTRCAGHVPILLDLAGRIADADVLLAFAELAVKHHFARPEVDDSTVLEIRGGRHPVIERLLPSGTYVPNDTRLDTDHHRLLIVTGPNMSGKSTWMRQTALIALMAQIGSFVPARAARVGVVDRIFTRVGAVDDLATGQSTFMVEMNETAAILHQAGPRSLILLDEIGRGTSTFDGISIAWSVAEFLASQVQARTLFATHYHEMTSLARSQQGVRTYQVLVEETDDGIVFLRRVVPGAADRSYGIEVARLAGLPPAVLSRARQILAEIERRNRLSLSLREASLDDGSEISQLPLFQGSL
ncbi:MAG: DNA mismatch repair protein MutS [Candidatus Sericytochromatia bacterium]|nr:DNA mismatch repair protein MutS [Candidatus Tanganyikabacteria bacterium]